MLNRCPLGISDIWVYTLAPLMKSGMHSGAVPLSWLRVFDLLHVTGRLVSVSLIRGY